ncbi:aminopeptidase P family protein [Ruminococcus flavefaciens]|uniref:Peptidase M24 n=1 Tax=Ruminococcus flavefaciens 007c TaxID=1341157 RepID=W7UGN1_RUMFL|nr:aminopeptidase P family protein [Ruminococcus flavefaciens]EWM54351.1 peptidase M24 [Ruminococcus flavefaciens 007c]
MTRFDRLFEVFEAADCVLITSDINRRYFTGMKSSAGVVLAFPEKAYLLIDFRYIEKARATVKDAEVIEAKKLYPQIMELLNKHGAKSVAIESETMTVKELNAYEHFFTEMTFVHNDSLSNAIASLRMIKDSDEITCIQKAQDIAEKAFDELLGFIKAGVTEREIALELNRLMFAYGAEDLSFDTIVLSGANTSMPHGVPSDKKVEKGDFVLMDFGAVYNGYHSDMTRTVCVGEPTDEMKQVYDTVLNAQLAGLEAAKAGVLGCDLDKVSRDVIEQAGYGSCFGHSLGHGVGLEIHEKPNASPNYKLALNEGSVVTVEPGIYIAGKFGVRIEDFVILTENGCKNLTKSAKNLIYL